MDGGKFHALKGKHPLVFCKILAMKLRKTRFVAKKHKHFYILDENNFGRCKCGASKQFPVEKRQKLRASEVSAIEGIGGEAVYNPDSWLNATSHEVRT